MDNFSKQVEDALKQMVEDTVMILTNDLPSLFNQEYTYKLRRAHKDQILQNLPKTLEAITAHHSKALAVARQDALRKFYAENYQLIDNTPLCLAIKTSIKAEAQEEETHG